LLLVQEQLEELGPMFEHEPLDDYIFSPVHDRFFTPEQLEHATVLEDQKRELLSVSSRCHVERFNSPVLPAPASPVSAAHGSDNACFTPVTSPADTVDEAVHTLVNFDGGVVILTDVNPSSGLEQVSCQPTVSSALRPPWHDNACVKRITVQDSL
jgi:hypothetical protein